MAIIEEITEGGISTKKTKKLKRKKSDITEQHSGAKKQKSTPDLNETKKIGKTQLLKQKPINKLQKKTKPFKQDFTKELKHGGNSKPQFNKKTISKEKPPFKKKFISKEKPPFKKKIISKEKLPFKKKTISNESKKENLTRKEKKLQHKKRKHNFETGMKLKKMWETLRKDSCPKDKKITLSQELHNLIKGKVKEFIFAHDTSRVVECLMACGTPEIREALFEELKDEIVSLCKFKYSKFFVLKILMYGTKAQRRAIIQAFYGKVVQLMNHSIAASVVEIAYNDYANVSERAALRSEYYGPAFSVFKEDQPLSLQEVIAKDPFKKDAILSHMKEKLMQLIQKSLVQSSMIHHLFLDYMLNCNEKDRAELIEALRGFVVQILHTHDGSRVGMNCIWNGTAKDRKVIVKSMKSFVHKICKEEHGHMVLLAVFDCVDDTRLVQKVILEEMSTNIKDVICDPAGRKVILYLLSPRDSHYFHPDVVKILQQGDNNAFSKKDKTVRYKELISAVSTPLIQEFSINVREFIFNTSSNIIAQAIIKFCEGDKTVIYEKIIEMIKEPFISANMENLHIIEHPAGHLFIKHLLRVDKEQASSGKSDGISFTNILIEKIPQDAYQSWLDCNRGAFILVSIIETEIEPAVSRLKKMLKPLEKKLKKKSYKGAAILQNKLK